MAINLTATNVQIINEINNKVGIVNVQSSDTLGNFVQLYGDKEYIINLNGFYYFCCVRSASASTVSFEIESCFGVGRWHEQGVSTSLTFGDVMYPTTYYKPYALESELTAALGLAGTGTLYSANWSNNTYTFSVSDLGANDAIFITPATSADKALMEEADIFVVAGTGEVVFTATTAPQSNIAIKYYISRGA